MTKRLIAIGSLMAATILAQAGVVYEVTSPYHHIRVVEREQFRELCFDDATESRIQISEPLLGHYEYTEYFHMPWLWNTNIQNVLMIGLGAGTAQMKFENDYPQVKVTSVEIDPVVVQVAKKFFSYKESERQKVFTEDGRLYLRRNTSKYDLILLDAYVQGRYGSSIPQHLATKEFFQMVKEDLTTNGVIAFNVIGSISGWHANIVGSIYRTMNSVFPQVYLFPARSSANIVILGTQAKAKADITGLRERAKELVQAKRVKLPNFRDRIESFRPTPPPNVERCPILTDDFAPVEGLAAAPGK